jgi:cytidylate kinase
LEATLKATKERNESDRKRYQDLYWIDLLDQSHYDLMIDTRDKTPEEVTAIIIKEFSKIQK